MVTRFDKKDLLSVLSEADGKIRELRAYPDT